MGVYYVRFIVGNKNWNSTPTQKCRRCRLPLISDSLKGDDSDLCDHCLWEMSLENSRKESPDSKSA